jgi:hypothetical protein
MRGKMDVLESKNVEPNVIASTIIADTKNELKSREVKEETLLTELKQPTPSTNFRDFKSEDDDEEDDDIVSIEIPEPILKKNPKRFNSGKELYDFLEKLQVNINKIRSESSNKIR